MQAAITVITIEPSLSTTPIIVRPRSFCQETESINLLVKHVLSLGKLETFSFFDALGRGQV